MIFWLLLFAYELFLIYGYTKSHDNIIKKRYLFFIILGLVYFAGFRDGLGMDYTGYKNLCEREVYTSGPWFLNEPIIGWIENFCYKTKLSAVIFFLLNAVVTNVLCLYCYSKKKNFYLAAFIYLFYTGLYASTLNVVAQFSAASIILYGYLQYFNGQKKNNLIILLLSICVGFFIHKSSIFMLLPLLFSRNNYNIPIILSCVGLSFVLPIGEILSSTFFMRIINLLDYSNYMDYENSIIRKDSFINIYMHIMLIPFLINKKKIIQKNNSELYIFLIKIYSSYLICNNLSAGGFTIAYRLAYLLVVFIPILLALLPNIINKQLAIILIVIPMLILTFIRISSNDRILVPERILPLNSIFDANYRPYENPLL